MGGDGGSGSFGGRGGRGDASSAGGRGGDGTTHGQDAIARGLGGDVLPGSQARGGAGGSGVIGGGAGGGASILTLRGVDGTDCHVSDGPAPRPLSTSSGSTGGPAPTASGSGPVEPIGEPGAPKDSPGLALPLVLTVLALALLMRKRA